MAKSQGSLDKQLEKLIKVVEKQDRHERAARKLEESSRSLYKPEETNGFARHGTRYASSYGKDAKLKRHSNLSSAITVSPLDVIELFTTLRSLSLQGKVLIKGNSKLMSISYETATATHAAFIPACDVKGKRIADHFTKFDADA